MSLSRVLRSICRSDARIDLVYFARKKIGRLPSGNNFHH